MMAAVQSGFQARVVEMEKDMTGQFFDKKLRERKSKKKKED